MKLKLELDVDVPQFWYGGLSEVLGSIGDTIQDSQEMTHPRTPIRGRDGKGEWKEIGFWLVE